jgi:epoxyqueuosine reductase QueG
MENIIVNINKKKFLTLLTQIQISYICQENYVRNISKIEGGNNSDFESGLQKYLIMYVIFLIYLLAFIYIL